MRVSVIPDLIDKLIAESVANVNLSGVLITDGIDVGSTPGYRLMIGVADPTGIKPQASAQADQDWPLATATARDESGSVTCAVHGWSGGGFPKTLRDEVFRIAGEVQTMARTNVRQSVAGMLSTSYTGQMFEQWFDDGGRHALLTFRLEFHARL